MHQTVVCSCGKQIATCRCYSPNKTIVVSDKPCTHVQKVDEDKDVPTPEEVKAKYASIFNVPTWLFEEVMNAYNKEILEAMLTQARDEQRKTRGE